MSFIPRDDQVYAIKTLNARVSPPPTRYVAEVRDRPEHLARFGVGHAVALVILELGATRRLDGFDTEWYEGEVLRRMRASLLAHPAVVSSFPDAEPPPVIRRLLGPRSKYISIGFGRHRCRARDRKAAVLRVVVRRLGNDLRRRRNRRRDDSAGARPLSLRPLGTEASETLRRDRCRDPAAAEVAFHDVGTIRVDEPGRHRWGPDRDARAAVAEIEERSLRW